MKTSRYKQNLRMRRLTVAQTAYLAGMIDGEGSICITKGRHKKAGKRGVCFRPVLHVASTNAEVLNRLQKWTGLGRARKFDDARDNRKARWQWMIWSRQAVQIVKAVLPFLIIKKRQGILFIKFVNRVIGQCSYRRRGLSDAQWNSQVKLYNQMKLLNA